MSFLALVAEDNSDYQAIMRTMLEYAGYEVVSAWNGAEALERLHEHRFHVMFLDLNMPVMSGNAVLQVVRSIPCCEQMYVIVITANSQNANSPEVEHADFVMMKPLKVEELAMFTERIKQSQRHPAQQITQKLQINQPYIR